MRHAPGLEEAIVKLNIAAFVAILLTIGTTGVATAQWDQHYTNCRNWEFQVGTRILEREASDLGLALVTDNVTNQVLLSDRQFSDVDTSAGLDMRVAKLGQGYFDWEARMFYQNWDGQTSATGTGALTTPFLPGLTPSSVGTNYESEMFSLELMAKKAVAPGLTLSAGPRFFYLNEVQTINSIVPINVLGTIINVPVGTTTETDNPLVGLQFGGEYRTPLGANLWANGFVKGGIYGNNAQSQITTNAAGISIPGFAGEKAVAGFVGEIGGSIHYDIVPGTMSAYASYEATWLDGVALAPAQLGTFGSGTVHSSSTPFFHGLGLGVMLVR